MSLKCLYKIDRSGILRDIARKWRAARLCWKLRRRIKARTVAVRDRQRAEIIVLSAAGIGQDQIALRVGVSRVTVSHWCRRSLAHRLAGLEEAAGRGRKPRDTTLATARSTNGAAC